MVPIAAGSPTCRAVALSAPSELAWLLNLLVQTARYADPALAELDKSLLPGIGQLRSAVQDRFNRLWGEDLAGCPELVYVAHQANCLLVESPRPLLEWLASPDRGSTWARGMLTEPENARPAGGSRLPLRRQNPHP